MGLRLLSDVRCWVFGVEGCTVKFRFYRVLKFRLGGVGFEFGSLDKKHVTEQKL